MPVTTRRNPVDSVERARQDDLSTVDHRDENPQDQPQLETPSGAPRGGAGRPTSLLDRMHATDARQPRRDGRAISAIASFFAFALANPALINSLIIKT